MAPDGQGGTFRTESGPTWLIGCKSKERIEDKAQHRLFQEALPLPLPGSPLPVVPLPSPDPTARHRGASVPSSVTPKPGRAGTGWPRKGCSSPRVSVARSGKWAQPPREPSCLDAESARVSDHPTSSPPRETVSGLATPPGPPAPRPPAPPAPRPLLPPSPSAGPVANP